MFHNRDSDRMAARSDTPSTLSNDCGPVVSTDVFRRVGRSKLQSRVRGVEQLIRAPSGARVRDRDSVSLGRCRRAPNIPMSSCTRQLPGRLCKPLLPEQKRSFRWVLDVSKRAPK